MTPNDLINGDFGLIISSHHKIDMTKPGMTRTVRDKPKPARFFTFQTKILILFLIGPPTLMTLWKLCIAKTKIKMIVFDLSSKSRSKLYLVCSRLTR